MMLLHCGIHQEVPLLVPTIIANVTAAVFYLRYLVRRIRERRDAR